jgi:ABC-type branched-subunit amino acid transport system permease subunit
MSNKVERLKGIVKLLWALVAGLGAITVAYIIYTNLKIEVTPVDLSDLTEKVERVPIAEAPELAEEIERRMTVERTPKKFKLKPACFVLVSVWVLLCLVSIVATIHYRQGREIEEIKAKLKSLEVKR